MPATRPGKQSKRTGIPPGWMVLDEEWTTVVNAAEHRLVVIVERKGVDHDLFACYQRWGTDLEFLLIGWVPGYEDAEIWLAEGIPSVMAVRNLPAPVKGLEDGTHYGFPQEA